MSTLLGSVFNTEVLKQPRGFMRCLQFLFAMLAFSCCAGFGSHMKFSITCSDSNFTMHHVNQEYSYPFQLDHLDQKKFNACGEDTTVSFPGDFSSDAKFFVAIGVLCWLYTIFSLYVYCLKTDLYEEGQKNLPLYDLAISGVMAFFWLACSSAWAHGVSGLKSAGNPDYWIFQDGDNALAPICSKSDNGGFIHTSVKECTTIFAGNFAGANISVLIGFLNVFLWSANLWFLYKETKFFGPNQGNLQNVESPTTDTA